jgi:DMSO/TMAO reductase YedYZ heme-binding membrane subunit
MKRSTRRHVAVGAASGVAVLALMVVTEFSTETWGSPDEPKTEGLLWQFNVSTGLVALTLLVVTLSIGPVRGLRGRGRRAVHLPWRRVTGVWSAILVGAHVPGGLAMHTTGWRLWTPFASAVPGVEARAFDEFTIGYWTGALALVALVPLVVTSTDGALRRLGPIRWKRLHNLTYAVFVLVAVHVVAMQYGEGRDKRHVALTALVFSVAVIAQAVGLHHRRRTVVVPSTPLDLPVN